MYTVVTFQKIYKLNYIKKKRNEKNWKLKNNFRNGCKNKKFKRFPYLNCFLSFFFVEITLNKIFFIFFIWENFLFVYLFLANHYTSDTNTCTQYTHRYKKKPKTNKINKENTFFSHIHRNRKFL